MPVEVVITKDKEHNDIDVFLTKIFNIRLDIDDFLRYILTTRENREQITLSSILYNYKIFKLSKEIIRNICKYTIVSDVSVNVNTKKTSSDIDIYLNAIVYYFLSRLKDIIYGNFRIIEKEEYKYEFSNNNIIEVYVKLRLRVIYILFAFINNYKDLYKVIKFTRKGNKQYGKSSNN